MLTSRRLLVPPTRPLLATALLAVAVVAAPLGAQPTTAADSAGSTAPRADSTSAPTARSARQAGRAWQVIPFVGFGTNSPLRWGATPNRDHRMLGVQFARPFARAGPLTLAYAPNVVPVFVLTNNPAGRWVSPVPAIVPARPSRPGDPPDTRPRTTATLGCESDVCTPVYGVAAVPLGIRADLTVGRVLTVYTAAGMGVVRFARTVPVPQARRTNVTFEGGGGVLVRLPAGPAVQVGYKYHHLSNAFTARRNPGVDGDVLYAGLAWTVRERSPRP